MTVLRAADDSKLCSLLPSAALSTAKLLPSAALSTVKPRFKGQLFKGFPLFKGQISADRFSLNYINYPRFKEQFTADGEIPKIGVSLYHIWSPSFGKSGVLKKFNSQKSDYYGIGIVFLILHGLHDGKLCFSPLVCFKEIQKEKVGFLLSKRSFTIYIFISPVFRACSALM